MMGNPRNGLLVDGSDHAKAMGSDLGADAQSTEEEKRP